MKQVLILENRIQRYAWGSSTAISELLGKRPPGEPEAELWMSAHPRCPSLVNNAEGAVPLDVLIARHPEEILGRKVAERFGRNLPFLFKVLAAARALSIQAHPSLEQAREGFARENAAGIPIDAPHRNYRDDNHKPELIVALTEFWALKGFRPIDEIVKAFDQIGSRLIAGRLDALRRTPDERTLSEFFQAILTMDGTDRGGLAEEVVGQARTRADEGGHYEWLLTLNDLYPGDVGLAAALLLNLVRLEPGEGLYLPAGELHAYLDGTGIEVMANSDNVLRGGLTPKHIDVAEMLATLSFKVGSPRVVSPRERSRGEWVYPTPADEFELSEIRVDRGARWSSKRERSVEILLCVDGSGVLASSGSDLEMPIAKGVSLLVPAAISDYTIEGPATIFRTAVPGGRPSQ